MSDGLVLTLNGRERAVEGVLSPAMLREVLTALALRADRIAVELNGELAPRTGWADSVWSPATSWRWCILLGVGRRALGLWNLLVTD